MRILGIIFILILIATVPQQASAGGLGCLLGAAAGGFGGAQIGKGSGRLAATAAGALFGCGAGSNIQNNDNSRYQQYQPQYGQRNGTINYSYNQRQVPYVAPQPVYHPQPQVVYVQPQQQIVVQSNRYCREYTAPITVGGRVVEGYGQACSWDGGQSWDLGPLQRVQ